MTKSLLSAGPRPPSGETARTRNPSLSTGRDAGPQLPIAPVTPPAGPIESRPLCETTVDCLLPLTQCPQANGTHCISPKAHSALATSTARMRGPTFDVRGGPLAGRPLDGG